MMTPAQGDGELIADLSAECAALCEAEVMSIRRLPAADQTWMGGDELDVLAVTNPARLWQG